jgi:hypothetical protein
MRLVTLFVLEVVLLIIAIALTVVLGGCETKYRPQPHVPGCTGINCNR